MARLTDRAEFGSKRKTGAGRPLSMSVAVALACLIVLHANVDPTLSYATPESFKEIFIGRCDEYQEVINPRPFDVFRKNCSELWELFHAAFAYRDACDVPVERYENFTRAADHAMDTKDKVLYWSGNVYPLVYEFTADMRRYVTIRDILSGYMIRNVYAWCGQNAIPGYNSTDCPPWGSCPNLATPTYWKAISKSFAMKVEGNVRVLLNGSSGAAYRNTSTFAQYELAFLEAARNPRLSVLLIHNIEPSNRARESCLNGSLVSLQEEVEKRNMKYECIEDPPELKYFQCVDYVTAEECQRLANSGTFSTHVTQSSSFRVTVALLFFTQIFIRIDSS